MDHVHIKGNWVLPNFPLAQFFLKSEDNRSTHITGLGEFQPFYIQCLNARMCARLQSCPTLCDPMDCSPPGSSVHGILQERILERIACAPPGDLPNLGLEPCLLCRLPWQVSSLPLAPPGKPCDA